MSTTMLYRKLPKGKEEISILGIGTSSIQASGEKEIEEIVSTAIENGINFFDMASSEAKPFAAYGRAMAGVRDKVYFQIHFGANYETGTYGWTTDLDTVKRSIDWQLRALQSDYANLAVKADACVRCGHCNRRCPFHVDQMARMQEMDAWFM